jgi:GNAT superfamily N-acetyltransferase
VDIRNFTDADLEATVALMRDGGWGDRRIQLDFVRGLPEARILVADDGGPLVANGLGSKHGDTGWIGLIFVAPDQRGRGLGAAITSAVAADLKARGCSTLLLIATEMGRPVYERLGFAAETVYQEWAGPPLTEPPTDPRLRRATPADLPAMASLDRDATGENRRAILERLLPGSWALDEGGVLHGFVSPTPWGRAVVIAPEPADGAVLFDLRRSLAPPGEEVRVTLPERNVSGVTYMKEAGFHQLGTQPRMRRGAPVNWNPSAIWGISSSGLG